MGLQQGQGNATANQFGNSLLQGKRIFQHIQHFEYHGQPGRINILQPLSFSLKKAKELIGLHAKALKSNRTAFKYNEEILHRLTAPVHIGNHNFTAHIFFNEKIELDKRHRFLSNLLDIESQHKECKFDSQKEAQAFINTEIPEKLRPFFHREKSSNRIVKNGSKMKRPISKLGYFIIITNDNI